MKIGIIADTATDTEMGKRFFEKSGYDSECRPIKENTEECIRFFQLDKAIRELYVTGLINELLTDGAKAIVVYANSICEYVDFTKISSIAKVRIITPFDTYGKIALEYSRPTVWTATAAALYGIEKRMAEANADILIRGVSRPDIAVMIENGLSPEAVIEKASITTLLKLCEDTRSDSVVLGCTHFPMFKRELEKHAHIPIIDPADMMLRLL